VAGRFPFAFDPRLAWLGRLFGVTPETSFVEIGTRGLVASFGPWRVTTCAENLAGADVTGPYRLVKVAGPAHLSLADRGLTFATNADRGVCIRFVRPVRGIDPVGLIRHPALTVTVADSEGLVAAVDRARTTADAGRGRP
jgi:hypothetical protein